MNDYRANLLAQPDALRLVVSRFGNGASPFAPWEARWRTAGRPRIVITGMGASLFAAEAAATGAAEHLLVSAVSTSALIETRALEWEKSLIVAVSQSGDGIELREMLRRFGSDRVLALTNRPDGWLARHASATVSLGVPEDGSIALATYVSTIAALEFLFAVLRGRASARVVDSVLTTAAAIEQGIHPWDRVARAVAEETSDARSFTFLGWGSSTATAREAALVLREGARTAADAMGAAQFRHGPVEIVDKHHVSVLFVNEGLELDRPGTWGHVRDYAELGGTVVVVGETPSPETGRLVRHFETGARIGSAGAITDAIPVQLLAQARADVLGFAIGDFRNSASTAE